MPSPSGESASHPSPSQIPTQAPKTEQESSRSESPSDGLQPNGVSSTAKSHSSIQEGKEKAKAVMAASGHPVEMTLNDKAITSTDDAVNGDSRGSAEGTLLSRKRSRSGTRISQATRVADSRHRASSAERRWKSDKEVEQFVSRDLIYSGAAKIDDVRFGRLMNSLRAQKDQYEEWLKGECINKDESRDKRAFKGPSIRQTNPGAIFGMGYAGYGNGKTNLANAQVLYPTSRPPAGGRRTRHPRRTKEEVATQAGQPEELVPIRLDIEWDKIRLRDTFTWNLHDRTTDRRAFAEGLVEDFKLPPEQCGPIVDQVYSSIEEQIRDYHPQVFIREEALDPHLPYHAYKDDEMRITIKLNITIGQQTLVDQFEWDMNNPMNCAEDFAKLMAHDLSLPGEFTTAIAHSIREQSQLFTRGLYVTGHPFDGRPIEDQELKASFLASPLPSSFRPFQAAKDFTPYLYDLNEAELEKTELSLSREERRQKRSVTRRGGPALPDLKDRRRTIRTLIVSSVLPGAAEAVEDSRILKRAPAAPGKVRRPGQTKEGLDESDESDSADSSPGSPAIPPYLMAGTARTRNIRGAASAATAAMRSGVGRSMTPEVSTSHHHETRTSRRQPGGGAPRGREYREESVDDSMDMIVKLKVPRERFRQLIRSLGKVKPKPESLQAGPLHASRRSLSGTPGQHTPAPGSMAPPLTTPGSQPQRISPNRNGHHAGPTGQVPTPHNLLHPHSAAQIGRVDAAGPPSQENPIPAPPPWLTGALQRLQQNYPNDAFEGTMRYTAVSLTTDQPIALTKDQPQNDVKYMFYPRIKCKDCPGKLYTPGPEMGVNNFEVHLKNRLHREKVEARVAEGRSA
ncbi:SWI/SNF chromatin-remodeling complex subunit [Xanthoria parietina]